MARALRLQFENALYHVCARGNRRQRIFVSDTDYVSFEHFLSDSLKRYQVELHCYVLLPNHFHFLARTLKPNLSRWMHWLITNYSLWFNRRHRLSGHLFQGRFKGFLVQENDYLMELSRYLHLNPVRGLVLGAGSPGKRQARLRYYPWSSYRGYAGLTVQKAFVCEDFILGEFAAGDASQKSKIQYRQFVEEGLLRQIENPFEKVRWQSVLGDETFVRRLMDRFESRRGQRREVTAVRDALRATDSTELLDLVAKHYGTTREKLMEERAHGSEARNVAMWFLRQKGGLTLREIGLLFGGIDYAAVSDRIRRVDREIACKKRLRTTCHILNL